MLANISRSWPEVDRNELSTHTIFLQKIPLSHIQSLRELCVEVVVFHVRSQRLHRADEGTSFATTSWITCVVGRCVKVTGEVTVVQREEFRVRK